MASGWALVASAAAIAVVLADIRALALDDAGLGSPIKAAVAAAANERKTAGNDNAAEEMSMPKVNIQIRSLSRFHANKEDDKPEADEQKEEKAKKGMKERQKEEGVVATGGAEKTEGGEDDGKKKEELGEGPHARSAPAGGGTHQLKWHFFGQPLNNMFRMPTLHVFRFPVSVLGGGKKPQKEVDENKKKQEAAAEGARRRKEEEMKKERAEKEKKKEGRRGMPIFPLRFGQDRLFEEEAIWNGGLARPSELTEYYSVSWPCVAMGVNVILFDLALLFFLGRRMCRWMTKKCRSDKMKRMEEGDMTTIDEDEGEYEYEEEEDEEGCDGEDEKKKGPYVIKTV